MYVQQGLHHFDDARLFHSEHIQHGGNDRYDRRNVGNTDLGSVDISFQRKARNDPVFALPGNIQRDICGGGAGIYGIERRCAVLSHNGTNCFRRICMRDGDRNDTDESAVKEQAFHEVGNGRNFRNFR